MQNRYKNVFVDATVLSELPYMQIWTVVSNRNYTELLISQVRLRTTWATEQTYQSWKPIDMKLDMCDAFSNLPAY